jgi:hypothetical protein
MVSATYGFSSFDGLYSKVANTQSVEAAKPLRIHIRDRHSNGDGGQ